jgi:hypothetical protein
LAPPAPLTNTQMAAAEADGNAQFNDFMLKFVIALEKPSKRKQALATAGSDDDGDGDAGVPARAPRVKPAPVPQVRLRVAAAQPVSVPDAA